MNYKKQNSSQKEIKVSLKLATENMFVLFLCVKKLKDKNNRKEGVFHWTAESCCGLYPIQGNKWNTENTKYCLKNI